MKTQIMVMLLIVSNSAFAMGKKQPSHGVDNFPSVGNRVSYGAVDCGELDGTENQQKIVNVNAQTGFQIEEKVILPDGHHQPTTKYSDPLNEWGPQGLAGLVKNCSAYGGSLERIQVVAGTFDTCKMAINTATLPNYSDGYIWWGEVPFGKVKLEGHIASDGNSCGLELTSYSF